MGTKAFLKGHQLETAKTLATSFDSAIFHIPEKLSNIGIHIDCASVTDNTGDFDVQHRINDGRGNQSGWASLGLDTILVLASADKNMFANLNQIPPGDLRVVFTAAGTIPDGTCDIWVCGQEM